MSKLTSITTIATAAFILAAALSTTGANAYTLRSPEARTGPPSHVRPADPPGVGLCRTCIGQ